MFIELILIILAGTIAGFLMGLIPGIHPNMIILAVPFFAALAVDLTGIYYVIAFIVSLGVANSFASFIPSIFLGASDDEALLSAYPGHKMLLEGRGHEAVMLTVFGGIAAVAVIVILLPALILIIPAAYAGIRSYIWLLLVVVSGYLVLSEKSAKKKILALVVFGISGIFGMIALNMPVEGAIILFPILSGFFAMPVLAGQAASKTAVPNQRENMKMKFREHAKPTISGTVGGIIAGFLPGVGSSVIASLATRTRNTKAFMAAIGAITTANMIMSFLAIWLIGNPRSGVAVAISQIAEADFTIFLLMLFSAMTAAAMAGAMTVKSSGLVARNIHRIDYTKISVATVGFIILMAAYFAGAIGLLILVTSTALGIFTLRSRIRRGILMGVLIIPTILFFV